MLQLVSIDLDSSLGRNLSVCVDHILLNQDTTYFMSVVGLTDLESKKGLLRLFYHVLGS